MTLHWEESEDHLGFPTWLRYVGISHWGLILTGVRLTDPMLDLVVGDCSS